MDTVNVIAKAKDSDHLRKMLVCALCGFSSGIPLSFLLSLIPLWMRTAGRVDLSTIAAFSVLQLPYNLKFLWAPLLDRYTLPFLGRRRGWLLVLQLLLLVIMAAYSLFHPGQKLFGIVVLTGLLTFISATQDIVSDALRREILNDEELGLGSSLYVTAYRLANLVPGSLALVLSDYMPWFWVFIITSLFMLIGLWIIPLTYEPTINIPAPQNIQDLIIEPLKEYWQRRGMKTVILVIIFFFLYKFGDNLASGASVVFYNDIGFSRTVIGTCLLYTSDAADE